jgi:hypothetical protein
MSTVRKRSVTFGTTIRIAPSHHPSYTSCRVDDLRFLWTVGDRWRPLLPVLDRCDTDPARTEVSGACPACGADLQ